MNKAELYARYDNYGSELDTITENEFYSHFTMENKDKISYSIDRGTECQEVRLDGATYYMYSCLQNVGWEGDVEVHTFFCKKKTMTRAEIEEMTKLFTSEGYCSMV